MDEQLQITEITQLLEIGDTEQALTLCQRLHEQGSKHPFVLSFLAFQHLEAQRYDQALTLSQQAVEQSPNNVSLLRNLGIAQQKTGHLKQAVESFSSAINQGTTDATFYLHLGSVLHDRGNHYWACVANQKAFTLDSSLLELDARHHSSMTRKLLGPARRQLQQHLQSQFETINAGFEKRHQLAVSPRVHQLQQQLIDQLDLLMAIGRSKQPARASELDLSASLDWPETHSRNSFKWMIQYESQFPQFAENAKSLLGTDCRHHWQSHSESEHARHDSFPLMTAGERHSACLPRAAATLNVIEQLDLGRMSALCPQLILQRLSPGQTTQFSERPNQLLFHHFMPLHWPDGCSIEVQNQAVEQQIGRVYCLEQGSCIIRNHSESDFIQLQLTTLHPSISEDERHVIHSTLNDIENWLSLCSEFNPADLTS